MNIRQQLVQCLEYARDFERLGSEVIQWQQQIVTMQNEENRYEARKNCFRTICLIAVGFSALFIGVGIAMNGLSNMVRLLMMLVAHLNDPVCFVTWLIIAAMVLSGILWGRTAHKLRCLQADHIIRRRQADVNIQEARESFNSLIEYAYEEGVFNIVPVHYFGSEMLEYCISVVDRRLATSLKEVFWLLEQELQRQEQMVQQQLWHDDEVERMERLTNAVKVNTMLTMLVNEERNQ